MIKQQEQVAEFMVKVKELELPTKLTYPPANDVMVGRLSAELIDEESLEVLHELRSRFVPPYHIDHLERIAKELSDLLYVTYYACNALGIDIEPIFDEVHRSNMTKVGGPKREDGKQLKPDTYEPPDLEPLIKWQMKIEPWEPLQSLFNKVITIKNGFALMVEPAPIDKPHTSKLRIPEVSGKLVQFSDHGTYLTVRLEEPTEPGFSRLVNYDGLSEVVENG